MIFVDKLEDFNGPLKDMKRIVDSLVEEHGGESIIRLDVGANNIDVYILSVELKKE